MKIKNLAGAAVLAIFAGLSFGYSSASAQVIGVQTWANAQPNNAPLTVDQIAGVVPQAHFNVISANPFPAGSGPLSLVNSTGTSTGVTFTLGNQSNGYYSGSGTSNANATLLSGQSGDYLAGPATYTFSNVPAATYNLIVYTVTNNDDQLAEISLATGTTSGPTNYFVTEQNGADFTGTFILGTATSEGDATLANYVEFFGVTPVDGTIEISLPDFSTPISGVGVNGFQLEAQTVPEPSALAMMGISVALLLLLRYHRPVVILMTICGSPFKGLFDQALPSQTKSPLCLHS